MSLKRFFMTDCYGKPIDPEMEYVAMPILHHGKVTGQAIIAAGKLLDQLELDKLDSEDDDPRGIDKC